MFQRGFRRVTATRCRGVSRCPRQHLPAELQLQRSRRGRLAQTVVGESRRAPRHRRRRVTGQPAPAGRNARVAASIATASRGLRRRWQPIPRRRRRRGCCGSPGLASATTAATDSRRLSRGTRFPSFRVALAPSADGNQSEPSIHPPSERRRCARNSASVRRDRVPCHQGGGRCFGEDPRGDTTARQPSARPSFVAKGTCRFRMRARIERVGLLKAF